MSTKIKTTQIREVIQRTDNLAIDYSNYTGITGLVGGFYYPRMSPNPDWVSAMVRTDTVDVVTQADIDTDLDYLQTHNINTIRIVIQYNLTTYRTNPLVDGSFNHDVNKTNAIRALIQSAKDRGIKVMTQTNFGYEGALSAGDLSEMQDYVDGVNEDRFNTHIAWMGDIFREFPETIIAHKMFNEPDGFGVWADYDQALTVLKFLRKLKETFVAEFNEIPYTVNAVDHVNFNLRFSEMPIGFQSIYDLSDWAMFNSYYWADNGSFAFVSYKRQWDYMVDNNYDNKPLIMSECGFPSDYDGQGVGEASFVPENGQFDRPQGSYPKTPHNQESQNRAIREAVFYSEQNNAIGILCWSLFKHNDRFSDPNFFQDSFGVIDANGVGTTAFFDLKRAFSQEFSDEYIKPLSITSGTGSVGTEINGRVAPTANAVMAGVYIPTGDNWQSENFNLKTPYILNVRTAQLTQPADNGIAIALNFADGKKVYQFRYEDFSNRWRFFEDGTEVAATADASGDSALDYGTDERLISFDFSGRAFKFLFDDVEQSFLDISDNTTPYNINLAQTTLQDRLKIEVNATTADVEVREAYLSIVPSTPPV